MKKLIEMNEKYMMNTYNRAPIALVEGKGCRVKDSEGKEYLDFLSGIAVCNLGHCHEDLVKAVSEQMTRLMHCSNLYYIPAQLELAKRLAQHSGLDKTFFSNSGAEANEAAIKLARRYTRMVKNDTAYKIITANKSFHGRSLTTVTATGQLKYKNGFDPLPKGFIHVPFDDLGALEKAVDDKVCAVMLEPIQGEGGVNVPSKSYMQDIRELCNQKGLILIMDEVQTGMGRTGRMFAHEHYGILPDIMTLAKALGNGMPIGATIATEEVSKGFEPGTHGSTYGGNPIACTAGISVIDTLISENLISNAAKMGDYIKEGLKGISERTGKISEIRGKGLMIGAELNYIDEGIVSRSLEAGLLINCIDGNIIRMLPPLNIGIEEADEALRILEEQLEGRS